MDRQVMKLSRLITDAMDISKLKNDSLDMERSRFDANERVQEVVTEMRSSDPDHVFTIKRSAHAMIDADRFRIAQVLGNLFTNAVKYAPGENEVQVSCERMDGLVKISARDRGIGIRKEDQR